MKKEIGVVMVMLLVSVVGVSACGICGDVDNNGLVNIDDSRNIILGNITCWWSADVNNDGFVNIADAYAIVRGNLNCPPCYNTVLETNQEVLDYVKYCDDTDENEYIQYEYECYNFTVDLVEVLRTKNVPAYYLRSIDVVSPGHVSVLIDFPNENPMVIEPQDDEDMTDTYDTDNDGIVEYMPEKNYVGAIHPYYYIVYNGYGFAPFISNVPASVYTTDDGNMVADMNYQ